MEGLQCPVAETLHGSVLCLLSGYIAYISLKNSVVLEHALCLYLLRLPALVAHLQAATKQEIMRELDA